MDRLRKSKAIYGVLRACLPAWSGFCSLALSAAASPTVLSLQPKTQETEIRFSVAKESSAPQKRMLKLINLNPNVNDWYLLQTYVDEKLTTTFHLENAYSKAQVLALDEAHTKGVVLRANHTTVAQCDFFDASGAPLFNLESPDLKLPFVSACEGKVFIRRMVSGQKSSKEWMVDLIRRNVWGGEQITTFVKETIYKDNFLINAEQDKSLADDGNAIGQEGMPLNALVEKAFAGTLVKTGALHLETVSNSKLGAMRRGEWQSVKEQGGVYVSALDPAALSQDQIFKTWTNRVNNLAPQELNALSYHVAFDLDQFDLGFVMGTEHPSFAWSDRVPVETKKGALTSGATLAGPDGFDSVDPLVLNGSINPVDTEKVAATFTAGFKRSHGAFKWGVFSKANRGSHYGYVQNGTVLSSLIPGLATLVVYNDGTVDMLSWTAALNSEKLSLVKHARQNGVSIIESKSPTDVVGTPGLFVNSWNNGNWSGGVEGEQRTLRAGACIQERQEVGKTKRYLIYSYFSSATPNSMARVYQGYQCKYAMHLDMNALEHTYLALYLRKTTGMEVSHLIVGMEQLDKKAYRDASKKEMSVVPRFIGMPDNRDFFYLMRK